MEKEERQEYLEALGIYVQVMKNLEIQINALSQNTIKSDGALTVALFAELQIKLEAMLENLTETLKNEIKQNKITDIENETYIGFHYMDNENS